MAYKRPRTLRAPGQLSHGARAMWRVLMRTAGPGVERAVPCAWQTDAEALRELAKRGLARVVWCMGKDSPCANVMLLEKREEG